MKPSLEGLSPEEKRALLAKLLKKPPQLGPAALIQQSVAGELSSANHNLRFTLRFMRKQDPDMLRERFQRIVERHPALRTTYERVDGAVRQRVHEDHKVVFQVIDAADWTPQALRERLTTDAAERHDIHKLPMSRVRLYRRAQDDILQMEIHHLSTDLWSMEVMLAELEEPPAGPAPPSFMEFCAWQQAWMQGAEAKEQGRWWAQTVKTANDLELGYSSENDPSGHVEFTLDPGLMATMKQAGQPRGVTPFNMMLSALGAAVAHQVQMDDFCIAVPAANRIDPRFDNTVGFFANPLLYRQQPGRHSTWESLWQANRLVIAEAMDRQGFPLLQTVACPFTDVVLMFQRYQKARWSSEPAPEPLGIRATGLVDSPLGPREFLYIELPTVASAVQIEMFELKDGLGGVLRHRRRCVSDDQAQALMADILARLARSAHAPTSSPLP